MTDASPASVMAGDSGSLSARLGRLQALAGRQLFFVGGAPRSGTTWLQHLLDGHPEVSCQGEGLFWKTLAVPLEAMTKARAQALDSKNRQLFAHTGGYPLAAAEDTELLLGTGVLAAFEQQLARRPDGGAGCLAVGEKTPENVFLFPRLKALFPHARLIAIARDPRDVIASAWHIFGRSVQHAEADTSARKMAFVRLSIGTMDQGARAMVKLAADDPSSCRLLTYEALQADGPGLLGSLFRFLGVSDDRGIVRDCLARSDFARLSGGRQRGEAQPGSFLRSGVSGTWRDTLDESMNRVILDTLSWTFPRFGWTP